MADLLRIPDDYATRAALFNWFRCELTHDRSGRATNDELVDLLLSRLRRLSVLDPEA